MPIEHKRMNLTLLSDCFLSWLEYIAYRVRYKEVSAYLCFARNFLAIRPRIFHIRLAGGTRWCDRNFLSSWGPQCYFSESVNIRNTYALRNANVRNFATAEYTSLQYAGGQKEPFIFIETSSWRRTMYNFTQLWFRSRKPTQKGVCSTPLIQFWACSQRCFFVEVVGTQSTCMPYHKCYTYSLCYAWLWRLLCNTCIPASAE